MNVRLIAIGRSTLDRAAIVGPVGMLLNTHAPSNLDDDAVHPFLTMLEHARVSETQGPGSLCACVVYADRILRGSDAGPHVLAGRPFTRADVTRVAEGILDADDATVMAGFVNEAGASRYVVERVPSKVDNVEFVDSYEFKHTSKAVEGVVTMDGARVLVADGYIETVAEIHNILDRCGREGERLLICGRGFSDDVVHTLTVNRQRGTLTAYALTFPFNADDANTLVDIAAVVGGDVVSSLKGQLFSTIELASLPRIKHIRLRGQSLDIRGDVGDGRVAAVLLGVQNKLAESEDPVRSILERRVRRLTGACMIVRLSDGIDHLTRVESWDLVLRSLRASTHGVVDVTDHEAWPGRDVVPLNSVAIAYEMARKLVTLLRSIDSYT